MHTTLLIARCLDGDTAAFGELVLRHQGRLYGMVHRLVGNAEDARDVVQDAFLSAYQSLRSFRGDSAFFTWLYRIAVFGAISLKRRRRVLAAVGGCRDGRGGFEPAEESEEARPGCRLEREEEGRRIREALSRLSPEHRAVLILKDMEGQPYEAVALALGVPLGTVRSRLHRAREELRGVLKATEARTPALPREGPRKALAG